MSFVEKANKFKTQSITVNGKSLEDAQIVIPVKYTSSEYRTAVYIQQHLSEYTGYRLPIVDDNTGVGENEILIGKTTRTKETPGFCEYMIGINGASLFLVAGNTYAYDKALTVFKENIVPLNNKAIELKMPSGGFLAREDIRSTLGNGTENILEHKGDLRIMSLNIWGYTKEKDGKQLEQRNMQNAEGILTYLPDIIGLQECSPAACSGEKSIVNLLSDVTGVQTCALPI